MKVLPFLTYLVVLSFRSYINLLRKVRTLVVSKNWTRTPTTSSSSSTSTKVQKDFSIYLRGSTFHVQKLLPLTQVKSVTTHNVNWVYHLCPPSLSLKTSSFRQFKNDSPNNIRLVGGLLTIKIWLQTLSSFITNSHPLDGRLCITDVETHKHFSGSFSRVPPFVSVPFLEHCESTLLTWTHPLYPYVSGEVSDHEVKKTLNNSYNPYSQSVTFIFDESVYWLKLSTTSFIYTYWESIHDKLPYLPLQWFE